MGLEPDGGLLRVSLAGSTGMHEITRFATALGELLEAPAREYPGPAGDDEGPSMSSSTIVQPSAPDTARILKNYIGGAWVAPRAPVGSRDVVNPATGETIATVPLSGAADVDAAVAAARAAFPGWRSTPSIERARMLFTLRERLLGTPIAWPARSRRRWARRCRTPRAEVARAIEMVECACAIPTTMQGRNLEDVSRGIDCETYRQPVGVFAAIVPFNFPAMVPMWFLPFAIACGNTFILKPSEQVPQTQSFFFEIIEELGLPAGVVNLVNGARETVESLLDHPGIDGDQLRRLGARSPSSCTSGPRAPASAYRPSAAPRTTWWSCPTRSWARRSTASSARRSARRVSAAWPAACS